MFSVRSCVVGLIGVACIIIAGCGGGSVPDPEQTARSLFEMEWNGNFEETWDLFHPIWQKNRYDENFARYANAMEQKNAVWAEHPRTITRSKVFSGSQVPGGAQGFVAALGRDAYDFSVVRIGINYPKVEGYHGGNVDYLITLAKKKQNEARWQIISRLDEVGVTEFFNW